MKRLILCLAICALLFTPHPARAWTSNYFNCMTGSGGALIGTSLYTGSTNVYPNSPIPAALSALGTRFHFTGRASGGGGGGARGGSTLNLAAGGGGAAGESFDFWCNNGNASASITIGAPGVGGGATGLTGSDGGALSITCGGVTVTAAGGGAGYGQDGTSGGITFGGVAPGGICAAGTGDAILIPGAVGGGGWTIPDGAGWVGMSGNGGGDGGGRGCMAATSGGGVSCAPNAGTMGGGGAGGLSWTSSGGTAGAAGGGGFVKIDEYSISFSSWNATTHVCTPAQQY
jgi:hypothetical protein